MPRPAPLSFIEPAQPVLVDEPPTGDGWLHEIKQDGFRTELIIEPSRIRAFSRSGFDWTERYPAIVATAGELIAETAIIDGEMIVPDAEGRSDFHALARAIKAAPQALVFVAFDLMHLDGVDLRNRPLSERRELLQRLVEPAGGDRIVLSRAFEGNGHDVFKAVEQLGLEGIVSKRVYGYYRSGTKVGWYKTKSFALGHFDVIGVDKTPGGAPVALLAEAGVYKGQAFIGLDTKLRDVFWQFVEAHKAPAPPVKGLRRKGATWLLPGLRARAKFLRGEPDILRHASVVEITLPRSAPRRQQRGRPVAPAKAENRRS